jgi:hypothetical protein
LISLAFLLPFKLGNVRCYLKKTDTVGTKKAHCYRHGFKEQNPMLHFVPSLTIFFKELNTRSRGLTFWANPLLLTIKSGIMSYNEQEIDEGNKVKR